MNKAQMKIAKKIMEHVREKIEIEKEETENSIIFESESSEFMIQFDTATSGKVLKTNDGRVATSSFDVWDEHIFCRGDDGTDYMIALLDRTKQNKINQNEKGEKLP